jgi:hypothetical protein
LTVTYNSGTLTACCLVKVLGELQCQNCKMVLEIDMCTIHMALYESH